MRKNLLLLLVSCFLIIDPVRATHIYPEIAGDIWDDDGVKKIIPGGVIEITIWVDNTEMGDLIINGWSSPFEFYGGALLLYPGDYMVEPDFKAIWDMFEGWWEDPDKNLGWIS